MEEKNEYNISFFKPTTPQARANRNMVILFVSIWAVSVFGFQILLRILEKPTPEPAYETFVSVWDKVKTGNGSTEDLQDYAKATLSVLGKQVVNKEHSKVLRDGLNWSVYQLLPEDERMAVIQEIKAFQDKKKTVTDLNEASYVEAKTRLVDRLTPYRDISENDVRKKLITSSLDAGGIAEFEASNMNQVPEIMSKYLIHNRSFLTDYRFLGFPFHYFYTSVFLLILFVGLCWMYCVRTDKINKQFNIED
jgi:putative solute:sodium symporter small subunit